jgi:hypothetical protein
MCDYFSCILLPGGRVAWTEFGNHETIIRRMSLPDVEVGNKRKFLRVEVSDGSLESLAQDGIRVDSSNYEYPSWFTEHEYEYQDQIAYILRRVNPIHNQLKRLSQWQDKKDAKSMSDRKKETAKILKLYESKVSKIDDESQRNIFYAEREVANAQAFVREKQTDLATTRKVKAKRKILQQRLIGIKGYVGPTKD